MDVSSGVAVELAAAREALARRQAAKSRGGAGAAPREGLMLTLADEFFRGVGNRHTIRKRPLNEKRTAYQVVLKEFRIKVVDTHNRGAASSGSQPRNPLPVFAVAMRPATQLCMVVVMKPSSLFMQRVLLRVPSGAQGSVDGNMSDVHLQHNRIVAAIVDVAVRGKCGGISCTTSPELVLATPAATTVARHYQEVEMLRSKDRLQAETLHRAEARIMGRGSRLQRLASHDSDAKFVDRVANLDRLFVRSPRRTLLGACVCAARAGGGGGRGDGLTPRNRPDWAR
jgi:hypothetical protein